MYGSSDGYCYPNGRGILLRRETHVVRCALNSGSVKNVPQPLDLHIQHLYLPLMARQALSRGLRR